MKAGLRIQAATMKTARASGAGAEQGRVYKIFVVSSQFTAIICVERRMI